MSNTYHRIIRKLVIGFGNLFDNITLIRYNIDETENRRFKVPIIYSPKEKYVARLIGDPDLDKKVQVTLPRMSFDLVGMEYDSTRKQVTNVKNTAVSSSSSTKLSQYNPVPYNFNFELYLYVRNIEDGTQIIEHILPYFTPDYTIKLNLVPSMGISKEIPILLNNVDYNIDYEGNETSSTRIIIWTLKFTAKGFVYGAVNEGKVIKKTLVSILNSSNFLPKNQVQFNMSSDGFGRYKIGETVYQGYSLDTASSTASVVSYNTYSNTNVVLLVNNIVGNFTTNTSVIGFDSQAQHNLNSFQIANGVMVLANTTITPANATSNTYFTYVDKITEYY